MSTHTDLKTADDLLRMPDDGMRRELVAGELREMAPAGHEHGRVTMKLAGPLALYVDQHNLGAVFAAETGFLLAQDPDTVRAPDVALVVRERLTAAPPGPGYFPGPPDLAVEVISPGDTYSEVEATVEQWLDAGSRMVVVVNPRSRTLKVHRSVTEIMVLTDTDTWDGGDVVPGFRIPFASIFAT
jgi:Uma2 family endonuclease